mgnify:CR=1 FL=1
MRAHPRSRGATGNAATLTASPWGPSPLTRGNRRRWRTPSARQGPIPAHAGQPVVHRYTDLARGAHPRSRGATADFSRTATFSGGPSPLTRGNPLSWAQWVRRARPIPAHAGQPPVRRGQQRIIRAHPRSRGATPDHRHAHHGRQGPSPLTRGNRHGQAAHQHHPRPIPAHAGQPRPWAQRRRC